MKSISSARKSRRGRPRIGATPVNTRFPPHELANLDAWIERQQNTVSRPEAVRRLVAAILEILAKEPGEMPARRRTIRGGLPKSKG
jgi:hypothetical protein